MAPINIIASRAKPEARPHHRLDADHPVGDRESGVQRNDFARVDSWGHRVTMRGATGDRSQAPDSRSGSTRGEGIHECGSGNAGLEERGGHGDRRPPCLRRREPFLVQPPTTSRQISMVFIAASPRPAPFCSSMKSAKKSGLASFQRFFSASGKSWNSTPFCLQLTDCLLAGREHLITIAIRGLERDLLDDLLLLGRQIVPDPAGRIHTAFVGPSHSVMSCTCLATS